MHNNFQKPYACLSLLRAGSMRFRWDEKNENRDTFFSKTICTNKTVVPLELIHSKTVLAINEAYETKGLQADGIITCNQNLVPVVTVADCMPIFLWDSNTGCFGVLHSGWKGTGIVTNALELAHKQYGARVEDFHAVIGPHIKDCCYTIDENRAEYFSEYFTPGSVELIDGIEKKYRLSLEKANIFLLEKAGVKPERITVVGECTCCAKKLDGNALYGSFRRQTAHFLPNSPIKEMQKHFTPMAAFMYVSENTLQSSDTLLVHKL